MILEEIVSDPERHARWLNTLSYLENCGAKLIARCEHPTIVPKELLKHAAEEFRHAYYLKAQIPKIIGRDLPNYHPSNLLGSFPALHYLFRLNIQVSRFLKEKLQVPRRQLKEMAYVLVTYAIEMRAHDLYPRYQQVLSEKGSPVSVVGIIREEEQHLKEIEEELVLLPNYQDLAKQAIAFDTNLYDRWITEMNRS